ncbi:MAG: antitoxin VapB family protein [Candidatus Altiarchaeota archaeon]|nr:antitoxin VapB family protein [Candidatus Altiarchaeota archaeon]
MPGIVYICVCIYIDVTKVISLSNAAYSRLSSIKGKKESFSDVVMKITEKKKPITEFAGKWKGDKKELVKIFDNILKEREKIKIREVKL